MVFHPIPLIIAFIFSLFPLILGIKRKKYLLSIIGCCSTVLISGSMHVIVSILLAGLFTLLILKEEQVENQDKNEK